MPLKGGNGPGETRIPDVPYAGRVPKCPVPELRAWWREVTRLPHVAQWGADEWQQLAELALLRAANAALFAVGKPQSALLGEARNRADRLGLSAEARRRLGIVYVPVKPTAGQSRDEWLT